MSKENYTHIAVIMDRSGSMSGIAKDMEGGLRKFIEEQKKVEGNATITLVRFDDAPETVYAWKKLQEAGDFNLQPRGCTALLDAMGSTLESERAHIAEMPENERPDRAILIVITDGDENASHNYNRDQVFAMIEDLRNNNAEGEQQADEHGVFWDFVFLGANQDSIKAGGHYGVRAQAAMNYDATSIGTQAMYRSLSDSVTSYRGGRAKSFSISKGETDKKHNRAVPCDTDGSLA